MQSPSDTAPSAPLSAAPPKNEGGTVLVLDSETLQVLAASPRACAVWGFTADEMKARSGLELAASLSGQRWADELAALQAGEIPAVQGPVLLMGKRHSLQPAQIEARLGGWQGIDGVRIDVTDVSVHPATKESDLDRERLFPALVDTAPDAVITINELGQISSFNAAAEQMFGYPRAEVVGRNIKILMTEPDAVAHDGHLARHFHTGERRIIGIGREVTAKHRSGESFPVRLSVGEVRIGDRRVYVGFLHDVSERARMQAEAARLQRELTQLTRLSSMGEMAATVAHELNQPLTAITSYAEICRLQLARIGDSEAAAKAGEELGRISEQALRAGEIIRRLRQLAKGDSGDPRREDLNAVVSDAAALIFIWGKHLGIEAAITLEPDLPPVTCDRIQVQQVIVNLVRNAVDALTDPAFAATAPGPMRIAITVAREGDDAIVAVRDTGPGVSQAVRDRLFDSFTTTKMTGMGLGLSVSRSIIEAHGGRLWLVPENKLGAEFRFSLPLSKDEDDA